MQISKQDNIWRINFSSYMINPKLYSTLRAKVLSTSSYAPLRGQMKKEFISIIRSLNTIYCSNVTFEQAVSMRNSVLLEKSIGSAHRIKTNSARIAQIYKLGNHTNIQVLSELYDLPPLALLREIILHNNPDIDEAALRQVFDGRRDAAKVLPAEYVIAFRDALKIDINNPHEQRKVAATAQNNENIFVEQFIRMGINLKTQGQLVDEQIESHGRAMSTPDLLFIDPVFINGYEVRWIDYKDYVGCSSGFLYNSNIAQAKKYTALWGRGAIAYNNGYVSDLSLSGAIPIEAIIV